MKNRTILVPLFSLFLLTFSCAPSEERLERQAARIHQAALTVDSHVDTPMWLTREGFDFGVLQPEDARRRSRLDLARMQEGGLDGVFFAVFTGQNERDSAGNAAAYERASRTMDSIEAMLVRYPAEMALATNPETFRENDRNGKTTIFLGMENGYPLGLELGLVDTFYNRGIRYITLCHSQNNDICDSSTDSVEHGGLSDFGREVVGRMNDLGIMIDLSHASDETFSQVIQMSSKPVIASHSCARALCDNPRNLTDEMLVELKENGGVIQMCILSAYVVTPEPHPERDSAREAVWLKHGNYYELDDVGKEAFLVDWFKVDEDFPAVLATVSDAVDHIDHIVKVAGIDHVGIGTDFDGGGGLEDCQDVSQLGNITTELVRRGYSNKDIEKIWSGNLMRVMEAQETKP